MSWYIKVLKQYVDFKGRARRKEYWMFYLFQTIIGMVLMFLLSASAGNITLGGGTEIIVSEGFSGGELKYYSIVVLINTVFYLGTFLPALAVVVRRLHDTGRNGAWFLIGFIPIIGQIWLFILMVLDSQPGSNKYGPNPKGVGNA